MAELRHHMPHGLAMCSVLFILMALITRGDAVLNDRFANVRSEAEAQEIFTLVMLSTPAFAASGANTMGLGDTGAGMHCVTSKSLAVEGSLRPNSTIIVTANGTTAPKYRCDVDIPLRTDKGVVVSIRLKNMLVLDNASHNLISLGRLATEAHVGLNVEATTGTSFLSLPKGHKVPLINAGVLMVPVGDNTVAASPAV
eukprot:5690216-Pleurochrysis_carterae.AAC.1